MKLRFFSALWPRAVVLPIIVLPIALAGSVSSMSRADTPTAQLSPSHTPPRGILPGWCSAHDQKILKLEIEALKRLKQLARGEGEKLCATIEAVDQLDVDTLIDPKSLDSLLTQRQRELLQSLGVDVAKMDVGRFLRLLGIDPPRLDLRRLKQQCRQSQGGIDRFATDELGRLEQEILRCDERV
jgi:hypothetical protein